MQHLVPDLRGEGASEDEVVHGLEVLVAEGASSGVLQPTASKAVYSPASVEAGKPVEEADARQRPFFHVSFQAAHVVDPAKVAV